MIFFIPLLSHFGSNMEIIGIQLNRENYCHSMVLVCFRSTLSYMFE